MAIEPAVAGADQRRWWALGVLCLVLVVIGMDNLILNVVLPTLVRQLHATSTQLPWIVDGYILAYAGLLLSGGSLGDRFGRKLALNAGLVTFVAGSAASAFAGSAGTLIATRAAMGVGAALIMPSTLSIITNTFPERERGRAIGIWAGVAAGGILLGPVVGGWLLDRFWWGSVFLINVPVVGAALLAAWALVPDSRDPDATPLDPAGALLSIAGLVSLAYAIIQAPSNGWAHPVTLGWFAVAVVLLGVFIAWELRSGHPVLPLGVFRNPRFSAASLSITLVFFAMLGVLFLLTQHLQFVLGYTPLQAGSRLLPVATVMVAAPLSARLVDRVGTKAVVVAGMLLSAFALWLLTTVGAGSGYAPVAAALALIGVGQGLAGPPATTSIMGSLPLANAGVSAGINTTIRQVGSALGVAVLGSVLASGYTSAITPALKGLPTPVAAAARNSIGAATQVAARLGPSGKPLLVAARSAFVDGMGMALLVGLGFVIAGALVALLFLPSRPAPVQPEPQSELPSVQTTRPPQ